MDVDSQLQADGQHAEAFGRSSCMDATCMQPGQDVHHSLAADSRPSPQVNAGEAVPLCQCYWEVLAF